MRSQEPSFQSFVVIGATAIALLLRAAPAAGQALHSERFAGGCELVFVTQPLAGATTVAWPQADGGTHAITLGQLNLVPDVESALLECGMETRLLLQVHDELILEVPRAEVKKVEPLVHAAMENAVDIGVPLKVNLDVGPSWGAIH